MGDWPELGQTTLYTINDPATGKILKWGITDNPATRYDMSDFAYWNKQHGGNFQMSIIKNFDSESDAWSAEYYMTSRHPGPENYEPNAGTIPTRSTVGEDLQTALSLFPSGG